MLRLMVLSLMFPGSFGFLIDGSSSASLIVDAPWSRIQGTEVTAPNQKTFVAFRNIPYAKPPVGDLRFAKPEPLPNQDGIFDATNETIRLCTQPGGFAGQVNPGDPGEEDCLILNIYVPKLDSSRRKVMVFIHGGGFLSGSTRLLDSGDFVTEQDVILVTVNYRVGVFGFLSTENEASPGNYGLWDQWLALKWVKDNIAAFGGDADDVTISGESAGAAAVTYLAISPYCKGLFTKVYAHSGATTSTFNKAMYAQADTLTLAKPRGCWDGELDVKLDLQQSRDVIQCLRNLSMTDLASFSDFALDTNKFSPRIDGDFVPRVTTELLKDDAYLESVDFFNRKFLIAANNMDKSIALSSIAMIEQFIQMTMQNSSDEVKHAAQQATLRSVFDGTIANRLDPVVPSAKVKEEIFKWYGRRSTSPTPDIMNDLFFFIPAYDFLDALSRRDASKGWFLYFNHYPGMMQGDLRGVAHALDMLYWMDVTAADMQRLGAVPGLAGDMDAEDLMLKAMFSSLMGQFVNTGDLTHPLELDPSFEWPVYEPEGAYYLDFNPEPRIKRQLDIERKELWFNKVPQWIAQDQDSGSSASNGGTGLRWQSMFDNVLS